MLLDYINIHTYIFVHICMDAYIYIYCVCCCTHVCLCIKQSGSFIQRCVISMSAGLSSFYDRSPSMTRKATPQQHVVDVDNIAGKHYHLVS